MPWLTPGLTAAGAVIILLFIIIVSNIKIVSQAQAMVVERLGAYVKTWQTGLHIKIPFLERIAKTVSLKEQ
ncbi:MAG: peptidase, partial [Clostridia bacterium]|nr:peptidase [Clostridia bacterium]